MKNPHFRLLVLALVSCFLCLGCRSSHSPAAAPETSPPAAAAAQEATSPEGEPWKNTIKWATASEVDNFGYDIYRSESPDGPFARLTEEPIEGAGTTDEVSRYEFVDETIDPTKAYYYYIESISMEGVRERFTPVGKKAPKIPQEESP